MNFRFPISDFRLKTVARPVSDAVMPPQSAIGNRQSAIPFRGFMLVELLMAMFILALGLTAIAAIFPVASYLQKQTFNDAVGQQVQRNVEAIIGGLESKLEDATGGPLMGVSDTDPHVVEVPGVIASGGDLPLAVRCYPTAFDPDNDGTPNESPDEDPNFKAREFYWVPLFQDANAAAGRQWVYYVFILAKQPNATYNTSGSINNTDGSTVPQIHSATISNVNGYTFTASGINLQPGDKILCDNGMTPTVTDVSGTTITVDTPLANTIGTPKTIWYAPPATAGQNSPTVAIKVVS